LIGKKISGKTAFASAKMKPMKKCDRVFFPGFSQHFPFIQFPFLIIKNLLDNLLKWLTIVG